MASLPTSAARANFIKEALSTLRASNLIVFLWC